MPLYQAARDVGASQDALVDLFERIENFFMRLETYTEVPPTRAMMDLIVKILAEVLGILAIATKNVQQESASEFIPLYLRTYIAPDTFTFNSEKYLMKLLGRTDIEEALKRLDDLTRDEALMATAQILKLAHSVDHKVTSVDDKVRTVIDGASSIFG
jgi:hypothetical protein